MLRALFRRRPPERGFPLDQVTLRHARIGDIDVVYMEAPDVAGQPRHWYLGADDDGIALAAPMTPGPLVPGAPGASPARIESHLAGLIAKGREKYPDRIVRAFHEVKWKDGGRDLVVALQSCGVRVSPSDMEALIVSASEILEPVGRRLRSHTRVYTEYLRRRAGETVRLHHADRNAGLARTLTMSRAEIEGLAAMGNVALLRPVLDLGIRLDRGRAAMTAELLAKIGAPAGASRRIPSWMTDIDQYTALALRSTHVDWLPDAEDREGWAAMATLAQGLDVVRHPRKDWSVLTAPAKGDWPAFLDRCRRVAGIEEASNLGRRMQDASMNANHVQVGFHAFLNSITENGDGEDMSISSRVHALSVQAVVGDRALPAILENSRLWHQRFDPPAPVDARWEPLLPAWTHEGTGIAIAPIVSSVALAEEGEEMDHCVGSESFALGSIRDEIRILSLSRDGERLSTAEIDLQAREGGREVVQHLARSNVHPDKEAKAALEAYLALPEVREAIAGAEPNDRDLPRRSIEEQEAALEAWRPFLTGHWRRATLEDFRAEIAPEEAAAPAFR